MARTAHPTMPSAPQLGPLGWIALIPAIAVLAHGEWSLAVACGVHPYVAVGVPAALDIYAIRALRAGREVLPVVLVMVGVNGASHLITTGLISVTPGVVIACSAIPGFVLWRVHAIGRRVDVAPVYLADVDYGPSALPRVLYTTPTAPVIPARPTTPAVIEQAPPTPVMRRIVAPVDSPTAPVDIDAVLADAPVPDGLDPSARVIAELYRRLGYRPITPEIRNELKAAKLAHGDGTCREARQRAVEGDTTLARYPLHPTLRRRLTNA